MAFVAVTGLVPGLGRLRFLASVPSSCSWGLGSLSLRAISAFGFNHRLLAFRSLLGPIPPRLPFLIIFIVAGLGFLVSDLWGLIWLLGSGCGFVCLVFLWLWGCGGEVIMWGWHCGRGHQY
jgi:hypothetical protein